MHGFNCCLVFFQRNRIDFGMCLPKGVEHCGANDYGGIRQEFSLFRHVALCGVKQSDSPLLFVIVAAQNCAAVSFFKLNRGRANKHRIPLN